MAEVEVRCASATDGWTCDVRIVSAGPESRHRVHVGRSDLVRLQPESPEPTDLVRRSFEFLLARESPDSILGSFELPDIGRYFPEYEREIRRHV